jgi:ABC-2 type transport system permease protein
MNTMKWLMKREFWEHKGGFFWAPAVVGAIMTLFLGVTMAIGVTMGKHHGFQVNGVQMNSLSDAMNASERAQFLQALTHGYMGTGAPLLMVLGFVVFFFCLGSLFDERKDRSVLFWKSLPISDGETVLSKVLTALVVAPLIALAFATITSVLSLLFMMVAAAFMGLNIFGQVLTSPSIYLAPFEIAAILPVYVAWALPTAGWLMLVSSWARTKPFLWAVGVPVLTAALLSWFNAMFDFNWNVGWFWQHIVARGLVSVAPGSWFGFVDAGAGVYMPTHENANLGTLVIESWRVFASADLWIGVLAGSGMIYAAARIRRWKDEG